MRYLVLSDIHANLEALDAVLADAGTHGYDQVLVLGDLVGYGPDPNGVIDRVRALHPHAVIRGNHDKVAAGVEDAEGFNPLAQRAADWTLQSLTVENRKYLSGLATGPVLVDEDVEVCHGSPEDEDTYITSELLALRALKQAARPVCFYGHTHVPVAFRLTDTGFDFIRTEHRAEMRVSIDPGVRYLINAGSVGQPRDGDARAAFGIFDGGQRAVIVRRVAYAVERTQQKILQAGLPQALARRLGLGR
jgi:predicted phosphodiesterase